MTAKEKIGNTLQTIFGWGVYLCLIAGGLAFFGFLVALIMGGGEGSTANAIAAFIQKSYFPVVIRCTSVVIACGLVSMYFKGESALSMAADKKEAEKELNAIQKEQKAEK